MAQQHNVALFITCLTDQFYPHVGVAVTKVLEHFGCRVGFPEAQTCCGQPFFNNGYHPEAKELAKKFVRDFEPFVMDGGYVVTPSGSCCAMVREQYEILLGTDSAWADGAHRVLSRTYEFVEFLDKVLHVDLAKLKLPAPEAVTYHYTCHLRGIGVKDEGVRLLRQMGNVDFRPLGKTDQCCGFGGTFAIKYPAISGAIVEDKVQNVAATGAKTLVCNDAGCSMNISGMCHRNGMETKVRHIAELIAEAMGIGCEAF
ncbi:MAG TPA: (Fe-S)-binding protein [Tepidisphaeraceae bacterium]|nr:(Fe-S)-binding protein [Tepidisphaeraceae bacterium]